MAVLAELRELAPQQIAGQTEVGLRGSVTGEVSGPALTVFFGFALS